MFTRKISLLALISLGVAMPACDKSDDKSSSASKSADEKAGDAKADAKAADDGAKADAAGEKAGPLALEKLGLQAEATGDAKVSDAIGGSGLMIQAPGLVVTVEEASDMRPKDLEAAKKDADMYSPQNVAEEELEDGFVLTFDNEGGMGKNYFAMVRRQIGDKDYWCETTASQPEQQANAVAFCKSLTAG
jgi:hypothetical protein